MTEKNFRTKQNSPCHRSRCYAFGYHCDRRNPSRKKEPTSMVIPTLTVETPQKLSRTETKNFTLDVTISDFVNAAYPAASFGISFDPSHLEFLGVKEGNVFISAEENAAGVSQKLPEWNCNVKKSNQTGIINIMYLDLTGGKYAFRQNLLEKEDNVVLRLAFCLRGSARVGDVYHLTVEDAVFAATDETQNLATNTDTLKAKHGKIVIGE